MAKKKQHEPIHCLVYGDAGSMKSTFAATFPKPMRVFCFDPFGKDGPFRRRGTSSDLKVSKATGMYYRTITNKQGTVIIRIDYFLDDDARDPRAWRSFMGLMTDIQDEYDKWNTLVFDSATFMELSKRNDARFRENKRAKDPRRWYGASKEALEEILMIKCGAMPMNVVVLAHVNEEKDDAHGRMLYNPAAPGKLSKGLPGGYAEFYHAYVVTEEGENEFLLQTQKSSMFNACSQIPAPNPCAPDYNALWEDV